MRSMNRFDRKRKKMKTLFTPRDLLCFKAEQSAEKKQRKRIEIEEDPFKIFMKAGCRLLGETKKKK